MIFFQSEWYLSRYPRVQQEIADGAWRSAEVHYFQKGCREGLSPSPYFDEEWYRSEYLDVARAIDSQVYRSGLHHYLAVGAREGRNPKPDFYERAYLAAHSDVAAAVERGEFQCGYEHYLSSGELEGRSPNPQAPNRPNSPPVSTPVVTDLPLLPPLYAEVRAAKRLEPRLNLILPSLELRHMSGGPNTALNLIYRLAAAGIRVRLLSCDAGVEHDREVLWRHIKALTGISTTVPDIEAADGSDPRNPADIGENDIFFATAWWTIQRVTPILPKMRSQKFLYLIQDYEPGLSAWSTEHSMALETYSMDMVPVVNSYVLRDYFVQNRIGRFADREFASAALAFEPGIDRNFFFPEHRKPANPRRLLFYARPKTAQRNLFELGLCALHKVARSGLFSSGQWDLRFIGDPLPDTDIGGGIVIRATPWMNYESYARLMRRSHILLSLMLSPHPSYPPLEMAACGGVVVTNSYGCKTQERLLTYGSNILAPEPTVAAVAQAMTDAIDVVVFGKQTAPASMLPGTWAESFERIMPRLYATCAEMLGPLGMVSAPQAPPKPEPKQNLRQ
jgi:O-antigen biosynthesis protein